MHISIDQKEFYKHANRLKQVHKSALPVAVRNTLNSAAFDTKQKTMPAVAKKTFEERRKNFFKANSRVEKAQGFSLAQMHAKVGFIPIGGTNQAVEDLEQQERGGVIGGRSFIPLKMARVGRSWDRNVRRNVRISAIKHKITDSKDSRGKNKKERFTKAALHAGKNGYVLGNKVNSRGNRILYDIRSVKRKGRKTVVRSMPIFAVKTNRKVTVKRTDFMREASKLSAHKMELFYNKHAKNQLKKYRL